MKPYFAVFAALAPLLLSACAARTGAGGGGAQALDLAATGAINASANSAGLAPADSGAVLAALSALPAGRAAGAWRNAAGQSGGALHAAPVAAARLGQKCRDFSAARESYDGAALYRGRACRTGSAPWALSFLREEQSG